VADDVLRHFKEGHPLARAIVDTVRDALIVLDRDLRVVAASRSFYQTLRTSHRLVGVELRVPSGGARLSLDSI
jgi:PAS domain-containing protein